MNIKSGAHWQSDMRARLESAQVGVICLTRSNTTAPWINFEAGALSKRLAEPCVCPYLLDLEPSDVLPPLGMFQGRRALTETHQLVSHLNAQLREPLPQKTLDMVYERFWPDLRDKLAAASNLEEVETQAARGVPEMVAELLELSRAQERSPALSHVSRQISLLGELVASRLAVAIPPGVLAVSQRARGIGLRIPVNPERSLAEGAAALLLLRGHAVMPTQDGTAFVVNDNDQPITLEQLVELAFAESSKPRETGAL
jgi:hypothetical protein